LLEVEEETIKDQLLDSIVADAVRTVEEEAIMSVKLKAKEKEDRAVEIITKEAERKRLGNPIPEKAIRQKIRAKVNELFHT